MNVERCAYLKSQISNCKSAFTLVELMISIAMVVILMIGIHQVFKMSTDTVGVGNQLAEFSRANRSVQQIFRDDYQRLVKNAPLFILRSGVSGGGPPNNIWGAFTTEAERAADRDGDPLTQDQDGDGNEGNTGVNGELTPLSIYNSRNHRVDIVGFPANGLFRRHTANDGSYSSNLTSQDAFIFYEHVNQPTYTGGTPPVVYFEPGDPAPANRNNYLAGQWILGRVALLMRDVIPGGEDFISRAGTPLPDLSPLRWNSISTRKSSSTVYELNKCRYDLLAASLETLRQDVSDVRLNAGADADGAISTWWQPLVYKQDPPTASGTFNTVLATPVARFECNPRVTKPITSEAMAKAMPVMLTNCSQFVVEYAGDFLTQYPRQFDPATGNADPDWGNVTGLEPDGVIDYVVDHSNVKPGPGNYQVSARIRWYGLPRDTNGDRIITGFGDPPSYQRAIHNLNGQQYTGRTNSNEIVDVAPLWDVIRTYAPGAPPAAFEREVPLPAANGDYVAALSGAPTPTKAAFRYTCVFVNSAPAMIRIVLKLEDPAGRLPDGQWYEYVMGAP